MAPEAISLFQWVLIGLFGLLLGSVETVANTYYLVTRNLDLPRKQHGMELPDNASDNEVKRKTIRMLILGIVLLGSSLLAFVWRIEIFLIGGAAMFILGLIDYLEFQKVDMFIFWSFFAVIVMITLGSTLVL
ncbi:MAG: hypothetical protein ACE5OZ_17290 [Candidatus Heimdallarchaeota archaeon]